MAAQNYWDTTAGGAKGTETVPEPSTILLLLTGLLLYSGLAATARRIRRY